MNRKNVVGVAREAYGLDGPGFESLQGNIFSCNMKFLSNGALDTSLIYFWTFSIL
jgi:hypothetical protein